MTFQNLLNLVKTGNLKAEAPDRKEFEGLVRSGLLRLVDAQHPVLSLESRFDLAYNASHALELAALRLNGFRSENRYLVFSPNTKERLKSTNSYLRTYCRSRTV